MKKIYGAVALLLILPVLSVFYIGYVDNRCDKISGMLKNANSEEKFKEAKDEWQKAEKILALSVNHSELDSINESMTRAEAYLKNKEKSLAESELALAIKFIEHVSNLEKPTMQNIF